MTKSVSVIIPAYNCDRFITETLKSIFAQTYQPLEVIVVNDGSTDGTESEVEKFGGKVTYIKQSNGGVSSARNRGVAASKGDLLAFIDADDLLEPEMFEKETEKFASDPDVGFVHCAMREFDSDSGETLKVHLEGGEDRIVASLLLWEGPVYVHGMMTSREAFDAVGGFDVRMHAGEDWDLCYRIATKFKVRFVPEMLFHYRIHRAAAHFNVENLEKGMSLFLEKAFDTTVPEILDLRRRAFGNYHRVLAGSYYHSGRYGKFAEHFIKSTVRTPSNLKYFLGRLISSGSAAH